MNARITAGILSIFAIGLAACDDSPTASDAQDSMLNYDVAMVSADATIEDVRALRDPASGGYFMEGRAGTRSVSFYDAEGNEQEAYDELTTATIVMTMEMERELERAGWTAYMTRSREMTITGLEGVETTRTVNGFGSEEVSRSRHTDAEGLRTYEMSGTRTIEDVVHPVPRDETSYPLSGTITRNMTITITTENGTVTKTREVIITFNGTQYPEMTIDGEAFEIDLASRPEDMPFRHRHTHRIGQ